jgi:hypothetical protein
MEDRDTLYPYADGSRYRGRPGPEVFREIYEQAGWNLTHQDSVSGEGSDAIQTAQLRTALPSLLRQLEVKTLLDIPCGDFYWMKEVDLQDIKYTGGDIVPALIRQNQQQHADDSREFRLLDLTHDALPAADLLCCRDCLVHLSLNDIRAALKNIASSGVKWLLMTHFPEEKTNKDIVTGGWRPLNFCLPPFNLPLPHHLINEGCTEMEGAFADKSMALWEVTQIAKMAFLRADHY